MKKLKALLFAFIDALTGGMKSDLADHEQRIQVINLAFQNQQKNIETLNEMLVQARLRTKEVRDECIEDGLAVKRELTDAKKRIEELELRQAAKG